MSNTIAALSRLELTTVFRSAAELAESIHLYNPEAYPQDQREADGNTLAGYGSIVSSEAYAVAFARWDAWHDALKRITNAANRLKRALGATGPLTPSVRNDPTQPPAWPLFNGGFEDLDHPRGIRQGLKRLAYAAIDLSGYAEDKTNPSEWRTRGMRLLADGLAQILVGLGNDEKRVIRPLLASLKREVGWPNKPNAPAPFGGPEEYRSAEEPRCIDASSGFYTRDAVDHLEAIQLDMQYRAWLGTIEMDLGVGKGTRPDAFTQLRHFARTKLKGKERAVIEVLCDAGGTLSIPDLAIKDGVDWGDDAQEGFKGVQRRLNEKLHKVGWHLRQHDGAAVLVVWGAKEGT